MLGTQVAIIRSATGNIVWIWIYGTVEISTPCHASDVFFGDPYQIPEQIYSPGSVCHDIETLRVSRVARVARTLAHRYNAIEVALQHGTGIILS